MDFVIITKKEFDWILHNRDKKELSIKVDFGLKEVKVRIEADKAVLDNRFILSFDQRIKSKFCYMLEKTKFSPMAFFSEDTKKFYKLIPTSDWPSLAIGSVPMHKICLGSPYQDTLQKIELIKPRGKVLDTCTGLGYTAILASETSDKVMTFEKDENVLFLAKLNPFSKKLFEKGNIELKQADISEYISRFGDNYFHAVIHDPPTFKLSPPLYHLDFYKELFRVLKNKGRLYHYVPLYKVKTGFNFPLRVKNRLKQAGFKILKFMPQKNAILCAK
ncbi:MAG: spermine synthase [Candidatus Omnitrophica bacterium]|nr:spermine synthase [Candidatus Omnitrophota bacterium]